MIDFDGVAKAFDGRAVVQDFNLHVADGAFCALIGASGSGKSTILRMMNRLIEPDAGRIRFAGQDVADLDPTLLRRRMGYVIQSAGLFPHWSVARNIAAVPALLGWDRARTQARVAELMTLLRLDPALGRARPHELSGGQAQRVGVARALAADPDVLLMDEPFGALDPITRAALQAELARIHRETRKTIVFVTHDMDEALQLATQVVVLEDGRVLQDTSPADLLAHPANAGVGAFVGRLDRGLKLLSLLAITERLEPGADGPEVPDDIDCRSALSRMIELSVDRLTVVDVTGQVRGHVALAGLMRS